MSQVIQSAGSLDYTDFYEDRYTATLSLHSPPSLELNWRTGDQLIAKAGGDRSRPFPIGTFVEVTDQELVVETDLQWSSLETEGVPRSGTISLNIGEQISGLRRQLDALRRLREGNTQNPRLADILTDLSRASLDLPETNRHFFNEILDEQKQDIVAKALGTRDLFILRGPPGTGKTTVIAELVEQIASEIAARNPSARLLVTSQSNVPVDHVLHRIGNPSRDSVIDGVRLGRPEKITPAGDPWTLRRRRENWAEKIRVHCETILKELGTSQPTHESQFDIARDWIQEVADNISNYRDAKRELESLEMTRTDAERSPNWTSAASILDGEISVHQQYLDQLEDQIRQEFEVIRELLEIPQTKKCHSTVERELDLLRTELAQREDAATAGADPLRQLRTVIREWIDVVGTAPDFNQAVIDRSSLIAATCLYTGSRDLGNLDFEWAIVDEAGRATFPELLVPLVRARRAILIGDERQLPPIAYDIPTAWIEENGIDPTIQDKSFFERLVSQAKSEHPELVEMLRKQHRMHPAIGQMVSEVFYDGELTHGVSESERSHHLPWIPRPLVWYSTESDNGRAESGRGTSYANLLEVEIIAALLQRMERSYRELGIQSEIGVIAGYAAQREELKDRIRANDQSQWQSLDIEIATVDAFQGRDRDIVIYSTVRSNRDHRIGFQKSLQRINVAVSRARNLLIIVGDANMMQRAVPLEDNPFSKILGYMMRNPNTCRIERWVGGE